MAYQDGPRSSSPVTPIRAAPPSGFRSPHEHAAPTRSTRARRPPPPPPRERVAPPSRLDAQRLPPPPARPRRPAPVSHAPSPPRPPARSAPTWRGRIAVADVTEGTEELDLADLELEQEARIRQLLACLERLTPSSPPPKAALSADGAELLLAMGRAAEEEGEHDRALALYRDAALASSVAGPAMLARARLERSLGLHERALATLRSALDHATDDRILSASLYAELGELHRATDDHDEADYYFRRAAALDRTYAARVDGRPPGLRDSDIRELHTRQVRRTGDSG